MTAQRPNYVDLIEEIRQRISRVAQMKGLVQTKFTIDGDKSSNPIVVRFAESKLLCIELAMELRKIFEERGIYGRTIRAILEFRQNTEKGAHNRTIDELGIRDRLEKLLHNFGSCPGDFWVDEEPNAKSLFVFIFPNPDVLSRGVVEELERFSIMHCKSALTIVCDVHADSEDWSNSN